MEMTSPTIMMMIQKFLSEATKTIIIGAKIEITMTNRLDAATTIDAHSPVVMIKIITPVETATYIRKDKKGGPRDVGCILNNNSSIKTPVF